MLEKSIEKAVCDYAEKRGWIPIKLNGPGDSGKPDRLFLGPGGRVVLVEFKSPGAKPRKLQLWWANKIRELGHKVYFIDSKEVGVAIFK